MNTAAATVSSPLRLGAAAPRKGLLGRAAAGTWSFLLAIGHARGRRQLRELAAMVEANRPEFAAQLRRAAERGWAA